LTATIDDHLVEITLSTILAYGSFITAEHFHASGVMAVIAAGLVLGNYGKSIGMSPNTQVMMSGFWEYAGFLMNSLVFLLIGTQVDLRLLATRWQPVALAFLCVVLVRFVIVALLSPLCGAWEESLPLPWRAVIAWSGLRGSISMALAIGLPLDLPWRNEILLMTFGVVILSLYLEGLTMPWLLRTLQVVSPLANEVLAYEEKLARILMQQRGLAALDELHASHSVCQAVYAELAEPLRQNVTLLQSELAELAQADETIRAAQVEDALKVVATAQSVALSEAFERGLISAETRDAVLTDLAELQARGEQDPPISSE
jgi:CPA1 family monovalent cation:H+ antiporter